jgi:thiol-disulfide isomerase/thioredoxin
MKKIAYIIVAAGLVFTSCDTKKADAKMASEINELKDTLSIEETKEMPGTPFEESTLNETFTTLEGNEILFKDILKQHEGKVTIIDVWASWCPDCIKGFPKLVEVQEQFPNANYVFLSLDKTTDKWKEAVEKYNLKGSHYHINQKMKDSFGASITLDWIPRYIVINAKGEVILPKAIVADDPNLINIIKLATS